MGVTDTDDYCHQLQKHDSASLTEAHDARDDQLRARSLRHDVNGINSALIVVMLWEG